MWCTFPVHHPDCAILPWPLLSLTSSAVLLTPLSYFAFDRYTLQQRHRLERLRVHNYNWRAGIAPYYFCKACEAHEPQDSRENEIGKTLYGWPMCWLRLFSFHLLFSETTTDVMTVCWLLFHSFAIVAAIKFNFILSLHCVLYRVHSIHRKRCDGTRIALIGKRTK